MTALAEAGIVTSDVDEDVPVEKVNPYDRDTKEPRKLRSYLSPRDIKSLLRCLKLKRRRRAGLLSRLSLNTKRLSLRLLAGSCQWAPTLTLTTAGFQMGRTVQLATGLFSERLAAPGLRFTAESFG